MLKVVFANLSTYVIGNCAFLVHATCHGLEAARLILEALRAIYHVAAVYRLCPNLAKAGLLGVAYARANETILANVLALL
jgi:hypothetical protein